MFNFMLFLRVLLCSGAPVFVCIGVEVKDLLSKMQHSHLEYWCQMSRVLRLQRVNHSRKADSRGKFFPKSDEEWRYGVLEGNSLI